jgi:hypothetical protein
MADPITDLELTILGWVTSDFASLKTIDENVSTEVGRRISHEEIHATLLKLSTRGLVDAYLYDDAETKYEQSRVSTDESIENYWWLASIEGQHVLEMEPESP